MLMNIWWAVFFVTGMSLVLTGLIRYYALSHNLMDIPNERSSHTVPTPRGGGLAIVLSFLFALQLLGIFSLNSGPLFWALLGAGTWVALVGFLDDHQHIPARWRLLAHFVGATWVLFWFGGLPPLLAFGITLDFGWVGHLLAGVYLVWLINLYNFMDGIDGIASIESITVCLGGVILYMLSSEATLALTGPILLLVASAAGFLFWNFPPARIFMGDVGSGFLGLMLGSLQIQAAWNNPSLFWAWLILLGMFVVDATVTLIRRILQGEKFYEAHRRHAYQYAARKFGSHKIVSLAFGGINVFILLPVAALVALDRLDGVIGLLIIYTPLVVLALYFKAGMRETSVMLK